MCLDKNVYDDPHKKLEILNRIYLQLNQLICYDYSYVSVYIGHRLALPLVKHAKLSFLKY